jgi:micrococcal nuclease
MLATTLAALAAGLPALAGDTIRAGESARLLRVIDGDTIHLGDEKFRLEGFDAAEIHHAQCEAERRLGVLTKLRLEQLLQLGPPEIRRAPPPDQTDRYRRTLAQVFVNGEDVGCILIREGYARPWRGRRENWCVKTDFRKVADKQQVDCTTTSSIDIR